ncbi:MAG: NapC/NirT family cytochrome c [Deferribacteraceae bacterium]|jgi:nitrate/TMAO reductase-like tetraheme cytochrome c subunit|nr:NapC/NirT family cytochrome c [Deferribacteraceae bacterium]
MLSKIRNFFNRVSDFIKVHPVISLFLLVIFIIVIAFLTYEVMHLTSKPKFCKFCHPNEGVGINAEYDSWSKSMHAAYGVECLDCHSKRPGFVGYVKAKASDGLYDLVMEFAESKEHKLEKLSKFADDPDERAKLVSPGICLHCHSDKVNKDIRKDYFMTFLGISLRKLDTVKNPEFREMYGMPDLLKDAVTAGVEPNHAVHINLEVSCAECHESPSHSGKIHTQSDMRICFDCHEKMRAGGHNPPDEDDCVKCHVTQADLQEGAAAKYYGLESERWYMTDIGCVSCHEDPFVKPTKESCVSCHDDSYADMMVSFQEQFDEMYKESSEFYKKKLTEHTKMTPEKRAIFNDYKKLFKIVDRDKSRSIHNPDYVSDIFERMAELRERF